MKKLRILILFIFAWQVHAADESLNKNERGIQILISEELSRLVTEANEAYKARLSRISEMDIISGLLEYYTKSGTREYKPECEAIVSSRKIPNGAKLDFEVEEAQIKIQNKIFKADYIKVYLYIGLDRDLVPFTKGGKWRRILLNRSLLSFN